MDDILTDSDGDLIIEGGDFKVGNSLDQEVETILTVSPGQIREDGFLGVDLFNEVQNDGIVNIEGKLKAMLKRDGKRLKSFVNNGEKISVDVENL